jgi:hypothetical protein
MRRATQPPAIPVGTHKTRAMTDHARVVSSFPGTKTKLGATKANTMYSETSTIIKAYPTSAPNKLRNMAPDLS